MHRCNCFRISFHLAFAAFAPWILGIKAPAQTLGTNFTGTYSIRDLGAAGDVPGGYGAMVFKAGDTNTLLLAGNADDPSAKIYEIKVTRDAQQHITGFATNSSFFANAPGIPPVLTLDVQGGIDGGLDYATNGVLFYTSYPDGAISQIKPGGTGPSKQVRIRDLGIDSQGGGALFVPAGFPGAGRLKFADWSAWAWFDTTVTPDGTGTFNIANPVKTAEIVPYAQGLVYVKAGKPAFATDSVLIASRLDDLVVAYEVDANGDPVASTSREFLSSFTQVKGATVDPVTGDFLLNTGDFNAPRIILVGNLAVGPTHVLITSPTNGLPPFVHSATFQVYVDATQSGGSIARVDFYLDSTLFGTDPSAPFNMQAELGVGEHLLTAVAIDGGGNATTSAPVHISVVNVGPIVTLTAPAPNATLAACSDLTLVAQVQPGMPGISEITAVEFFDGPTSLAVSHDPDSFVPYTWRVLDLAEGTRAFSVRVTDNFGLSSVAAATNIVVLPLPLNKLVIHHYVPGQLKFCFKGTPGSNYVWETSATLQGPSWVPFLTNTATAGRLQVTNSFDNRVPAGFFRTRRSN